MGAKRLIVLFVEGETEEVFYRILLSHWRKIEGVHRRKIKIINFCGIGNYAKKAIPKYKAEVCTSYPDCSHEIFLAYDSDVFELAQKPPVDWKKIESGLIDMGAFSVTHLKAERMIEDWLLADLEGICKNLKIKVPRRLEGQTGYEKMKKLFKIADKVYLKGYSLNGFIPKLNFEKITANSSVALNSLKDSLYKNE